MFLSLYLAIDQFNIRSAATHRRTDTDIHNRSRFCGFLSTLWRFVRCLLDVPNRPLIIYSCVLLVRVCGICVVHLFRA